jgi:hypothetical protein
MHQQRCLRLGDGGPTEAIAIRLPEQSRRDAVVQLARLIVRATRVVSLAPKKEVSDEGTAR